MTAHFDPQEFHPAPALESDPVQRSFTTHDGTRIRYRRWHHSQGAARKGAVILLHRGHEHGGRMAHLPGDPALAEFDTYAWDARGHGLSDGVRGWAPDVATLVRDLDGFVRHICARDGFATGEIAIVAQSVGAVVAATWVHDYAPQIRAMVLAAPAFRVNLFVPGAWTALSAWQRLSGDFTVNSYVRPAMLSHDRARAASYAADALVTRAIASPLLLDLDRTAKRIVADAAAVEVPCQVLTAGADWVVKPGPQRRFAEELAHKASEHQGFPGLRHDILGEAGRAPVLAQVGRFLAERFAEPHWSQTARPSLLGADQAGFSREEADRLARPLAPASPERLSVAASRAGLWLGGALSDGDCAGPWDRVRFRCDPRLRLSQRGARAGLVGP